MMGLMPRRLQFLFPIFPASRQRRLFPISDIVADKFVIL